MVLPLQKLYAFLFYVIPANFYMYIKDVWIAPPPDDEVKEWCDYALNDGPKNVDQIKEKIDHVKAHPRNLSKFTLLKVLYLLEQEGYVTREVVPTSKLKIPLDIYRRTDKIWPDPMAH